MQHFTMAPHRGSTGAPTNPGGSPNAALLIDFDNVTMGIRSDLTRQLKELLNSDIIKGKVAVQRAYADWRRYAQYIVPLSEASVDLIFAPAYGSSKKNATDIRLAIDALELVFTRPEIGTYILLSGDSDFSSLVLKLKEYGKYVIGVGLRESASDLLVQNCDEYYSYSSLTGLTRAGDEGVVPTIDAWDLVERAINQMASDDDVMRSDRLKQVMVELDPTFDEGQLGFTKFNKFLTEAASRNRLALKKLENGQYEVQPYDRSDTETREERSRGRGRRDRKPESRGREARDQRAAEPAPTPDSWDRPEPAPEPKREARPRKEAAPAAQPRAETARPAARPMARERRDDQIGDAYELLRRAVGDLARQSGDAVRDSDIKRKMLELEPGWDEATIGFTKFSRFLRQAHDAEVVDLSRHPDGFFEARISRTAPRSDGPRQDRGRDRERERDNGKDRRPRGRGREAQTRDAARQPAASRAEPESDATPATPAAPATDRAQPAHEAADARVPEEAPAAASDTTAVPDEPTTAPQELAAVPEESTSRPESTPAASAEATPLAEAAGSAPDRPATGGATSRAGGFGRRGRRGAADGPPPLLPGQVVGPRDGAPAGQAAAPERSASPEAGATGAESGAAPADVHGTVGAEVGDDVTVDSRHDAPVEVREAGDGAGEEAREEARVARPAPGPSLIDSAALGLPTDRGAVIRYLSNSYQGVGQKTAEALIDAFGEDRVFQGLNDEPDRVREILGIGRRTDALLNAWQRDLRRRSTAGTADDAPAGSETPSA